jgi:lysine-N-methylase
MGWSVPSDRTSFETYQNLPAGPLRTLIDASVLRTPKHAAEKLVGAVCRGFNPDIYQAESTRALAPEVCFSDGAPQTWPISAACKDAEAAGDAVFAKIRMNEANQCPMLTEERLCRIQAEAGEALLSHACATYPRIVHSPGGVEENALTLSCPEAARLVLLSPDLLGAEQTAGIEVGKGETEVGAVPAFFRPIRRAVLRLVRNRAYPLWQRLFLLGVFCRRLDSIARGELQRSIPAFLTDFEATVVKGALRAAMQTLPTDRAAQLDVVLRLAGLLLHRSNVTPRFVECIQAFTQGIGNGPGATLDTLALHYTQAHDRSYAPFFERHPWIMENLLINSIFRCRFPFGRDAMRTNARPDMTREFALLTAQFALIRGLLIGVAGFHGEAFSSGHVVHTVQAASKHFEHHPEFLNMAHALLVESQMDGARGLAILLRNAESDRGAGEARPVSQGIYPPGPQDGRVGA